VIGLGYNPYLPERMRKKVDQFINKIDGLEKQQAFIQHNRYNSEVATPTTKIQKPDKLTINESRQEILNSTSNSIHEGAELPTTPPLSRDKKESIAKYLKEKSKDLDSPGMSVVFSCLKDVDGIEKAKTSKKTKVK